MAQINTPISGTQPAQTRWERDARQLMGQANDLYGPLLLEPGTDRPRLRAGLGEFIVTGRYTYEVVEEDDSYQDPGVRLYRGRTSRISGSMKDKWLVWSTGERNVRIEALAAAVLDFETFKKAVEESVAHGLEARSETVVAALEASERLAPIKALLLAERARRSGSPSEVISALLPVSNIESDYSVPIALELGAALLNAAQQAPDEQTALEFATQALGQFGDVLEAPTNHKDQHAAVFGLVTAHTILGNREQALDALDGIDEASIDPADITRIFDAMQRAKALPMPENVATAPPRIKALRQAQLQMAD